MFCAWQFSKTSESCCVFSTGNKSKYIRYTQHRHRTFFFHLPFETQWFSIAVKSSNDQLDHLLFQNIFWAGQTILNSLGYRFSNGQKAWAVFSNMFRAKLMFNWMIMNKLSDKDFPKYSWAHVAMSPDSLNLFTILWTVDGERPKFFATLRWETMSLNWLTILSRSLEQTGEPRLILSCKD